MWQTSTSASDAAYDWSLHYLHRMGTRFVELGQLPVFQKLKHLVLQAAQQLSLSGKLVRPEHACLTCLRQCMDTHFPRPRISSAGAQSSTTRAITRFMSMTIPRCGSCPSLHVALICTCTLAEQISIAYFVRTPEDSGELVFEDPRGSTAADNLRAAQPWAPFVFPMRIKPRTGLLVAFPSWLPHQVLPTPSSEERVSFSCNIDHFWAPSAHAVVGPVLHDRLM
jgi:hypothetical protein